MTDPPPSPETEENTGVGTDRGTATGTPRRVFVLGIFVAIVLVALMVLLHLTGTLGPGSH